MDPKKDWPSELDHKYQKLYMRGSLITVGEALMRIWLKMNHIPI